MAAPPDVEGMLTLSRLVKNEATTGNDVLYTQEILSLYQEDGNHGVAGERHFLLPIRPISAFKRIWMKPR